MFYIVEENSKLEHLEKLLRLGCYVEVISSHDFYHPKLTTPIAVYIRVLKSKHGYIIPIDHDEGLNVDKQRVYDMLLKSSKVYTINKKNLLYHFNIQEAIDISLLYSMVNYERLEINRSNSALNYFYNKFREYPEINKLVPLPKHFELCEKNYNSIETILEYETPDGFDFYNKTATNVFYLLEQHGIGIEYEPFVETFSPREPAYNIVNNTVLTSYNLYNATSRPTNAFNSVNFAAIPKSEQHRKCFHPANDYFVEFDFDGYHLRLLCNQIGYELTNESAHKQLAKHYFGTEEITDEQYKEAKQINFHAIYGKIPEKHKNLKIFKEIQEYIDAMWDSFKKTGCVWNPQSGKAFSNKLKDMHPAKLMNYMMQSLETSNNILILKEVLRYLRDKKTKISLYTYDAILFDFNKEDGKQTLYDIQSILENGNKYPVKFKYSNNLVL